MPKASEQRRANDESSRIAVGRCLREERQRQKVGLRELARRLNLSASFISQVERGRSMPSVGTLYAIASELGMSIDQLLFNVPTRSRDTGIPARTSVPESSIAAPLADDIVRAGSRKSIDLGAGVRWERLTTAADSNVEFLNILYDVGGASAPEDHLVCHPGDEYGYVLEGCLGVTVGIETYELHRGDSIAFDSRVPHRLFNAGDTPARGIWFVVGRGNQTRERVEPWDASTARSH